jgi:D-alanyl-D-alanine carboxypeptidase
MSLQDALYALLMISANNVANAIANNLGSYLNKHSQGRYFSCFDLVNESREANIAAFMARMNKLIKEINLNESLVTSPHGMAGNTSSAQDMARVAAECFKIPLFYKIVITKRVCIKTRHVDEDGEMAHRTLLL